MCGVGGDQMKCLLIVLRKEGSLRGKFLLEKQWKWKLTEEMLQGGS